MPEGDDPLFKDWLYYLGTVDYYYKYGLEGNHFTVFRLLTDFVCLYNYEFWFSLCKIVRSSVILLLPLFSAETP
jgi:hypothetical protein